MNDMQALVTSIGECSVSMIGKDHLGALTVYLHAGRHHATVTVALESNTNEEQLRAFCKFAEVEMMFFDDVTMELRLSDTETMDDERAPQKQLAYRV